MVVVGGGVVVVVDEEVVGAELVEEDDPDTVEVSPGTDVLVSGTEVVVVD